jgi:hypothetical protein
MKPTIRFSLVAVYLCAAFALLAGIETASAQSTDEAHPSSVFAYPITGNLGAGTYYYTVPAEPGNGKMILEFHPPDSGGSMSVSLSGPDCCPAEAYVGGDAGGPVTVTRQTEFNIPSRQSLLVTVYVAVASGRTIRFSLNLGGTIATGPGTPSPTASPTPAPTPAEYSLCTDLSVVGFNLSVSGTTRTISGVVTNRARAAFLSPAGQQWIEVHDIAKMATMTGTIVARIPFTEIPARGSFSYSATHNTRSLLTPRYRVRIVYSPLNATDRITTNDDCRPDNNTTLRYPEATL